MRESLTVFAILLIGVLTAALALPYAIDWDSHRALIERELSEITGTSVRVGGPIDLRILPRPVLRLGEVAAGDGAGAGPRLTAASLDAELSFAALLRGQVQVVDTTLVRPRLALVQAPDGGFGLSPPSGAAADRVSFDHLGVRGGEVEVRLADGRRGTLADLDLDGEAASLRGPFKVSGFAGSTPFRLATGALDGGRLRVKLHLDGGRIRPDVDLDGTVTARPGSLGPGFDGSAAAAGRLALGDTPAVVPWRATAGLSADRDGAKLAEAEVRAGSDMRALIAVGDGSVAFAPGEAVPRAALRLHGAGLDVDALAVAPAGTSIAPPQGADLVRRLAASGVGVGSLPLRLDLAASFDTATLAGQTALGASATLRLGPAPGAAVALQVDGPAGARLALDGRIEPGPAPPVAGPFGAAPAGDGGVFRGRAEARADDPSRVAAWLKPVLPDLAAGLAAAAPARRLAASGAVTLSAAGLAAEGVALRVGGTALAGSLSFTPAAGSTPPRLSADLTAEALDLDGLPDLAGAAAAVRGLDLDLSLSARAVALASSAAGPVRGSDLAVRVAKAGEDLRLERLAVAVDGARLDASGARDAAGARGDLRVSAPQFGPLAAALAPLLPAPATAWLRARATLLSPVEATLRAEAAPAGDGRLAPTRLALSGTAGGTRLDADLAPDGPDAGRDPAHRPVALTLHADAADGADLLRLLGLPAAGPNPGMARAIVQAKGTPADGVTGTFDLALGGLDLSYAGRAGPPGGAGRLALRAADLRPTLAALGQPAPSSALPIDATGDLDWDGAAARWRGIAATVGGSAGSGDLSLDFAPGRGPGGEPAPALRGRLAVDRLPADALLGLALGPPAAPPAGAAWSRQAFAAPAALPRAELALTVSDMPLRGALVGRAVSMALRTGPGTVAATDVSGRLGEGTFGGALALRRDGPGATLSGRLAWDGVAIDAGGFSGRAGGAEDLSGTGDSPATIVASLAGTGTLRLSGGSFPRTDPDAPARVLAAAAARDAAAERGSTSAQPTPPDPEVLRRDLAAALDRGSLPIGDAAAPAILTGGVLRAGPLRLSGTGPPRPAPPGRAGDPVAWTAEARFALDLGALTLSTRVSLADAPTVPARGGVEAVVNQSGPLGGEARREIDVASLTLAVQSAALARAQDRIDVVEQDIRERAAFERVRRAAEQQRQMERERAEGERRASAAAEAQARDAAVRAAAEAQKALERQRAEATRQKAEDERVEAQVRAAARDDAEKARAAARDDAEKQRFIEKALKDSEPPLDAGGIPVDQLRAPDGRPRQERDPLDPAPPPPIMKEGR